VGGVELSDALFEDDAMVEEADEDASVGVALAKLAPAHSIESMSAIADGASIEAMTTVQACNFQSVQDDTMVATRRVLLQRVCATCSGWKGRQEKKEG
jgi:phage-related tail protein